MRDYQLLSLLLSIPCAMPEILYHLPHLSVPDLHQVQSHASTSHFYLHQCFFSIFAPPVCVHSASGWRTHAIVPLLCVPLTVLLLPACINFLPVPHLCVHLGPNCLSPPVPHLSVSIQRQVG